MFLMAFCTDCGSRVPDNAAFCSECGTRVGAGAAAVGVPNAPPAPPLDYTIQGDNLQIVRVKLKPGQELIAEAGKMVYKTANVDWQTKITGKGIGQKLFGALKRKLTGESLFMTHFTTRSGEGEVGLAGDFPGRIQGSTWARGSRFSSSATALFWPRRRSSSTLRSPSGSARVFLGGEGFILQKLTGPGTAFIHAGGDFVEFELGAGEVLRVDTGCILAFDESPFGRSLRSTALLREAV